MKSELIIPTHDNDGSDNGPVIRNAVLTMCQMFGGATVYDASGFWASEEGRLYEDAVKVIISAATDEEAADRIMAELALEVLDATDQLAVFVSVGGKAKIIE